LDARPVLYVARQLPTGRGNVVAARLAHGGDHAGIHEYLGKQADAVLRRTLQPRLREGVEGNEVELAADLPRNVDELPGMFVGIVDAVEHDVFESDEIARRVFQVPVSRVEQFAQGMLAV